MGAQVHTREVLTGWCCTGAVNKADVPVFIFFAGVTHTGGESVRGLFCFSLSSGVSLVTTLLSFDVIVYQNDKEQN